MGWEIGAQEDRSEGEGEGEDGRRERRSDRVLLYRSQLNQYGGYFDPLATRVHVGLRVKVRVRARARVRVRVRVMG